MDKVQDLVKRFSGRKPLLNIILDGYGIGKTDDSNAIFMASTPFVDHLRSDFPSTTLLTHGKYVGLPGETDLGGSEVGHLTIGAGNIISQGPTLITNAIKDGTFYERPALLWIMRDPARFI